MKALSSSFLALIILGLSAFAYDREASAQRSCDAPLPSSLFIVSPGQNVAPEFSQFSGLWKGYWGDQLCSYLAVQIVDETGGVRAIYSVGKGPGFKPTAFPVAAKIEKGVLRWGSRTKFSFKYKSDKNLEGRLVARNVNRIRMRKVPLPESLQQAKNQTSCDAPLPKDLVIAPPAGGTASEVARFSGVWRGHWSGPDAQCSYLAVEQINQDGSVRFVYSWGDGPASAGFEAISGDIVNGVLSWGTREKFSFTFDAGGEFWGQGVEGSSLRVIGMSKASLPTQ